jgi:lysophospholipase L1-like esterase
MSAVSPCLIVGDSIALGIARERPDCAAAGRVGIGAAAWLARFPGVLEAPREVVIISLGANDRRQDDRSSLERVRAQVTARRVIWIVPANAPRSRANVRELAARHGDGLIEVAATPLQPDRVHPTGDAYAAIARRAR